MGGTTDDTGIFKVDFAGNVTQMFREGQMAIDGNGAFGQMNEVPGAESWFNMKKR